MTVGSVRIGVRRRDVAVGAHPEVVRSEGKQGGQPERLQKDDRGSRGQARAVRRSVEGWGGSAGAGSLRGFRKQGVHWRGVGRRAV